MKIAVDPRVRQYELTFLIQAGLTTSEQKKIVDEVVALLAKHQAKLGTQAEWGKKDLAYPIKFAGKPQFEAHYYHWQVTVAASALPKIEHELNLMTTLMRYLLIVVEA